MAHGTVIKGGLPRLKHDGEVGVVVFSVLTSHALEHIEIVELAQDYGDGLETGASGSFHTVMAESDLYVIADLSSNHAFPHAHVAVGSKQCLAPIIHHVG